MIRDRVKEILKQRGMRSLDLAAKIGVTQGTLSKVIQDNPTTDVIERIAAALGVEPFELFVTREEIEDERKRRMARLAVPSATVVCPCCGEAVCIRLTLDA